MKKLKYEQIFKRQPKKFQKKKCQKLEWWGWNSGPYCTEKVQYNFKMLKKNKSVCWFFFFLLLNNQMGHENSPCFLRTPQSLPQKKNGSQTRPLWIKKKKKREIFHRCFEFVFICSCSRNEMATPALPFSQIVNNLLKKSKGKLKFLCKCLKHNIEVKVVVYKAFKDHHDQNEPTVDDLVDRDLQTVKISA